MDDSVIASRDAGSESHASARKPGQRQDRIHPDAEEPGERHPDSLCKRRLGHPSQSDPFWLTKKEQKGSESANEYYCSRRM
jgi:hypothetical protein